MVLVSAFQWVYYIEMAAGLDKHNAIIILLSHGNIQNQDLYTRLNSVR
jgi:hypothetical protein